MTTDHGSRERVSWAIEVTDDTVPHPSTSTTLYGDDEDRARESFGRRAKAMRFGRSIRLTRLVTAEAWVQHVDTVDAVTKPPRED